MVTVKRHSYLIKHIGIQKSAFSSCILHRTIFLGIVHEQHNISIYVFILVIFFLVPEANGNLRNAMKTGVTCFYLTLHNFGVNVYLFNIIETLHYKLK